MIRLVMKMHSYLREKIVHGLANDSDFTNFIPKWAKDDGFTLKDLNKPVITIEGI